MFILDPFSRAYAATGTGICKKGPGHWARGNDRYHIRNYRENPKYWDSGESLMTIGGSASHNGGQAWRHIPIEHFVPFITRPGNRQELKRR
mgnify:CR=1 FL=1